MERTAVDKRGLWRVQGYATLVFSLLTFNSADHGLLSSVLDTGTPYFTD